MPTEPNRICVAPDSELARLLDGIGETPVLLEKNGKLYRITEEPGGDIWAGYEAEKARAALKKVAGSWADIDTDKLIAEIYRAREEGSRPATHP